MLLTGLTSFFTASLLKVFSGYYSDRLARRKPLAVGGCAASALAKLLLLASQGWVFVLLSRFADRVGKGVRSAPRDALIAESVPAAVQGRAFGLQRGMDFAVGLPDAAGAARPLRSVGCQAGQEHFCEERVLSRALAQQRGEQLLSGAATSASRP